MFDANVDPKQMMKALADKMPGLKTEQQFQVLLAGLDAFTMHLNAIFMGDADAEALTKKALDDLIAIGRRSTAVAAAIKEEPEMAEKIDASFMEPPRQLTEDFIYEDLVGELNEMPDRVHLDQWYSASKDRLDRVVSQGLRNQLFDAIRAKRLSLASGV